MTNYIGNNILPWRIILKEITESDFTPFTLKAITQESLNPLQDLPINTVRIEFTEQPLMRNTIKCLGKVEIFSVLKSL